MVIADSSLKNLTSEQLKQQIMEQTSNLEAAKPEEEAAEAEQVSEETETQSEAVEETSPEKAEETQPEPKAEETTQETKGEEETKPSRRIKHRGREVDIPEEKVNEYVSKGYDYESKMAEVRKMREELAKRSQQGPPQNVSKEKLNEEFVKALQDDTFGTMLQFQQMSYNQFKEQEKEERRAERAFKQTVAKDNPIWEYVQEDYEKYRDEGTDRELALMKAERDFFANYAMNVKQAGRTEGEKKAVLKAKAVIPGGSKKGATEGVPSPKDIKAMTSDQLLKVLKNAGVRHHKPDDW